MPSLVEVSANLSSVSVLLGKAGICVTKTCHTVSLELRRSSGASNATSP